MGTGLLVLALAARASAGEGTFVLAVEPNHSTVGFAVPIVGGMTRVTGKFTAFTVTIVLDEKDLGRCSVEAAIEAASVDTGIDARDSDLRGPAFFDVEHHPTIAFKSSLVRKRGDGYVAAGELRIRGVTKQIELPFKLTALDWEEGRPRLGVVATLTLRRLDFGVGAHWKHTVIPDFLGNEIAVEIFLWTKLGKPAGD